MVRALLRHDLITMLTEKTATTLFRACSFLLTSSTMLLISGCGMGEANNATDDDLAESEGAVTSAAGRSVSLKYEGTCEFLRNCSSYSKNLPAGKVLWGCTGEGVCEDNALWVAGPNKSYCGKQVRICKGSRCTNALVKDISVSRDWEASNGVLEKLDLPYGLTQKCSGFGGGKVTVTVGSKASESTSDRADADDDDSAGKNEEEGGCWSNTLGVETEELTCVQSKASGIWFQCKDGKWYRGVDDSGGPYGKCAARHPLEGGE